MIAGGHVKHLLVAYVHGELPLHLRQRVSRHIEDCDLCYVAMLRERDLAQLLENQVPVFGSPRPDQLARLLPNVLSGTANTPGKRWPMLPSFGLALIFSLVMVLALPVFAVAETPFDTVPDQPAPYMIVATATLDRTDGPPAVQASPTAVAERFDLATKPASHSPVPVPMAGTPVH